MRPFNQQVLETVVTHPAIKPGQLYALIDRPANTVRKHVTELIHLRYMVRGGRNNNNLAYLPTSRTVETWERAQPLRKRYAAALRKLDLSLQFTGKPSREQWLFRYLFGRDDNNGSLYHKATCGGYGARRLPVDQVLRPPWELWRLRSRVEAVETLCRLPASLLHSLAASPVNWKSRAVSTHEKGDPISPIVSAAWAELTS